MLLAFTRAVPRSIGPRTADMLRARGFDVHTADVSELAKVEAGVTCCSVMCYFGAPR